MKKLLIFILIVLVVGYCTFRSSDSSEGDSEIVRKYRIENARANFSESHKPYVNTGETSTSFSNNGISVWQLTSGIMNKYDQDKDGILDVANDSFLKTNVTSDNSNEPVVKTVTRGLLFTEADKVGETNGKVSVEELFAYLNTFDEDGNGELTTDKSILGYILGYDSEWEKFENNFGERIKFSNQ